MTYEMIHEIVNPCAKSKDVRFSVYMEEIETADLDDYVKSLHEADSPIEKEARPDGSVCYTVSWGEYSHVYTFTLIE